MSLATVYSALSQGIAGGSIDLWTVSANPGLPGLRGVLELFGIDSSYSLGGAAVAQGLDSVTLTGAGKFGQPGDPGGMRFNVRGTLLYVEDSAGNGVFKLTLAITDPGWVFSDFFNGEALPPSQRAPDPGSTVIWGPSFLVGVRVDSPAFWADSGEGAELHLTGFLVETAVFGPYRDFMRPWPLALSGTLAMPANWSEPPRMTLRAVAAGNSALTIGRQPGIPDGPAALALKDLGFELVIRTDLDERDWGRTAFSVLNLMGTVILGGAETGLSATLTTQVLTAGRLWHLTAEFDPRRASIVRGMAQLTTIFGLPALPLPDNFPLIDTFKFRTVELFFSSPTRKNARNLLTPPTLQSLAITIGSDQVWTPPVPFVTIHDVGTRWLWTWTPVYLEDGSDEMKTISSISGSVFGTFRFGGDDGSGGRLLPAPEDRDGGGAAPAAGPPETAGSPAPESAGGVNIGVAVSLPDLFIQGDMKQGDVIPLTQAFTYFFSHPGPPTATGKVANVTALGFSADPIAQVYHAEADIVFTTGQGGPAAPGWDINLVVITVSLELLSFWVDLNSGRVGGGISGVFALDPGASPEDYTKPRLMLRAEYPIRDPEQATGWNFSGFLYPGTSIDLTTLVARFLGLGSAPPSVPHLTVDRLNFAFSTGSKSYALGGTISARWTPEIFDTPLRITAAASIDIARDGGISADLPATGRLSGLFSINRIAIEAAMDVGVAERTYLFRVLFGEIWFQAVTSWRGEQNNRHQAISLQLGGTTLGEILEYLVNLAAPTLGFSLDPPWDVLKRIDLSSFVLTLDPKDNVVEFVFRAEVDLTVAKISTVGVRYTRGGAGKVDLILEGSFLGQKYEGDKALKWDVINEPPPAVPGQGEELVDLRYLGIGQRILLRNPPSTVRETLAQLEQYMKPVDDPKKLPGDTGPVVFSADSQWLIGLDIGIMAGTVDLGFIFNDPVLYGLSVALGGEKAGSLAGLRFEILYKKITDDIGMFRVELRVPDAFRTFQLGVASFTLGIVVVEVFTNGNFMIDLGFPYNRDFGRSFSVQAYVFIGRGGFYFGVLNGATSSRVPRITNGNFSPVLELGIGLAAGVGREIRAGILAGGAYVQIEVIFQGVLGWFNPDSAGAAPAKYFWAQGIAAIHGKVYGYVDFKIIKVSVTLEAYAQASALFESYRPTVFRLEVSVSAEAEVKIVFFTISFSFNVDLELEFVLGSVEQTPWILASDQNGRGPGRAISGAARRNPRRTLRALADHHVRRTPQLRHALFARGAAQDDWGWNPDKKLWPDGEWRTAHLSLIPAFTVGDAPLSWTVVPAAGGDDPDYRAAFVLCADSGVAPNARTAAATRRRSAALSPMSRSAEDTDALTSDLWVQVFLLYSLYSIPGGPASRTDPVTAGQMALLVRQLEDPGAADAGFALDMLQTIFENNLHLVLSGQPSGTPAQVGGMIAPLPPYLSWASPQGGDIDFGDYNPVGPWYEWGISSLMGQYFPVGGNAGGRPPVDDPNRYESFAAYIFRDYCLMIARAAVQEAQGLMRNASVVVGKGNDGKTPSLSELAAGFASATVDYPVRAGDTVGSVAEALGATIAELEFLNPGLADMLAHATVGTTVPVKLGIAPEVLAEDNAAQVFALATLALGTVQHQAASGETLAAIAALFNVGDLASFFQIDGAPTGLGGNPNLLRPLAAFDYPAKTWAADVTRLRAAATFFGRYALPLLDQAHWYAQAVFDMNRPAMNKLFPEQDAPTDLELPPGQTLTVPARFNDRSQQTTYVTVAGDTLNRIGITLTLEQVYPESSPPAAPRWQDFLAAVVSPSANTFDLPAWQPLLTLPGETMEALGRRLIADAAWTGTDPDDPRAGYWTYDWPGIVQWAGSADILSPLAVVPVPNASAVAAPGASLSFAILAQTYGISLADAAARLQDVPDLYAENTTLAVTSLPVQTVQALVEGVLAGESLARIVNQASRFLMAGLQLPGLAQDKDGHTIPSTTTTLPLYDLTGQQFSVAVSSDPDRGDEVALTLSVSSQADWITFAGAAAVSGEDDFDAVLARHPALPVHSPGVFAARRVQPGMLVLTGSLDTLDYRYTNAEILAQSPATALTVQVPALPAPLPLRGEAPRTYGLDHRIELQSPVALPIPDAVIPAVSGQPSIWPFSPDLLARAASGSGTPYEILATRQGEQAGRHAGAIGSATWGCLIPFTLRRVNAGLSLFTLGGVADADRRRLLDLLDWLGTDSSGKTVAFTLAPPAPNAGNAGGLTVLGGAAGDTFLVKTNLSTDTVPPSAQALGAPETPVYYASLDQLADFLLLLWEGSVVGGIGYYLGFKPELPASLFDDGGNATLQLLVVAGTQQAVAPAGRPLLAFNNCALVGPALDGAASTLFVESYDDSDMLEQALAPPGNVGFLAQTWRPDDDSEDREQMLRRLYSLLSFSIPAGAGSPYTAAASGMPIPPRPEAEETPPRWQRERLLRRRLLQDDRHSLDPKPQWNYDQVLPIYRFGPASGLPDVPGLPAAADDPYRGFGTAEAIPEAVFQLGFGDIFGNRTAVPSDDQGVTVQVGYTDPLIGVMDWPAIASAYEVEPATGGTAALTISITPRPSAVVPSPSQSGAAGADAAGRQAKKYAESYYQLGQTVTGRIITTLKTDAGPDDLAVDVNQLWSFAAGAYAFSAAAAQLRPAPAPAGSTLAGLRTAYNVRYAEMAVANADHSVSRLFGSQAVTVPAFAVFALHDSAAAIAAVNRPGWPAPDAQAILQDPENGALPLKPGAVLAIRPQAQFSTGAEPGTLAALAGEHGTTPALLAADNATAPMLEAGFVFSVEIAPDTYATVTVTSPGTGEAIDTFRKVADAFALQGVHVTPADLAETHAGMAGMMAADVPLGSSVWVAAHGETLARNGSGLSQDQLAAINTETPDLFDAGALIYLGSFGGTAGVQPDPAQTLRQFADSYACPMELLLQANGSLALPDENDFTIPGLIAWPEDMGALFVPYTLRGTDTLNDVASRFAFAVGEASAATQLALLNANMPLLLAGQLRIDVTVGGQVVPITTPVGGESFAAALLQVQQTAPGASMADLAAAVGPMAGALQADRLVLCPPCKFAGNASPDEVPGLYTVDAGLFALANAATPGLIAAGQTLYSPDGKSSVSTLPGDTFNTLIVRFAELGVQTDAAGIATAAGNRRTAFLQAGQPGLLPPAAKRFSVDIGSGGSYPGPVFPLSVALRLERPSALVHPDFDPAGPVRRVDSIIPAPGREQGPEGEGSLTFDAFIKAINLALPTLRIATGKTDHSRQDLWAVDFGQSGIRSLTVKGGTTVPGQSDPQPRYFALKPLYATLVTRAGVEIRTLTAEGTLSAAANPTGFQGIDVEVWAARFLADMDRFLSAPFAAGLYLDPVARPGLQSALQSKAALITAIPQGLGVILDIADPLAQDGLLKARETLQQQLGISLFNAYSTTTLVQFDRVVESPWQQQGSRLLPANLYGQLAPSAGSQGDQPPRGWTMTSAKTWLDNSNPFVTFLMTESDPASHRNVGATLEYDVSYIEDNISGQGLPDGYTASDWLSFVPPLAGTDRPASLHTDLGLITIPIPLRNFPALPIVLGQTATTSRVAPAAETLRRRRLAGPRAESGVPLADMPLWTYGFSYSHQHAEQDDVTVTVRFNLQQGVTALAAANPTDLFTELAKYIAVADPLWALLEGLTAGEGSVGMNDGTPVQNAVNTFATLAANIADHWSARLPAASLGLLADGPQSASFEFRARVTDRDAAGQGREVDFLTLASLGPAIGPNGQWPEVCSRLPDGGEVRLEPEAVSARVMNYKVPAGVAVPAAWPVFTLQWTDLNVADWQNATGHVSVQRNQRLLGDQGPATNSDFVFKTEEVFASGVVTPINVWSERVQIIGSPGEDYVKTALNNAFNALFPNAFLPGAPPLWISMGIFYSFELAPDPADPSRSLVSEVPVALYPDKRLDGDTAGVLQAAVNAWKTLNNPNPQGGEWVFSLTLYSSLEDRKRPLLLAERLFSGLNGPVEP
jgi:hypothetical protein